MQYQHFYLKLTSDAKIQPAIRGKELKTVAFDFSHHGHALVTLYVQFFALIGQNLSILKLFLIFCQLVMFLTVFFQWM